MAIFRDVNTKNAGRNKLLATLEYVADPEKNADPHEKTESFKRQTLVNRTLLGKRTCKRHFKQYVLAMKQGWPYDEIGRINYEIALNKVIGKLVIYLGEMGYVSEGWVHTNTEHPHFHMLLETANAFSGKQYSQSLSDLAEIIKFLNGQLKEGMFGEMILGEIEIISEEELFEDGENERYKQPEFWFERGYEEEYEEALYETEDGIIEWNIGTDGTEDYSLKEMCTYAKGREMVRIVPEEEKRKGREMVKIISEKEKKRGYEMMNSHRKGINHAALEHIQKVVNYTKSAAYMDKYMKD